MEAEVRAAKERALVPLEIRVKSFKEMLKEKDVSDTISIRCWIMIFNILNVDVSPGVGFQYMGEGIA